MAVFRVERNRGYTVMSNHHLRNKELTLKAKGLLSQMLSLPEDWFIESWLRGFLVPFRLNLMTLPGRSGHFPVVPQREIPYNKAKLIMRDAHER